ncbi:MAG: QueT transporter family protein [Christensenellales bacterium]
MMKIKGNIRGMVYASAIAAIYVVLTLVSAAAGLSGGVIQFRLSEALTVLPVFTGAAVPGLFIGCAIANLVTGALPWDVAIGSLATLIGAYLTYRFRNRPKLAPVFPILSNGLIVPFVLKYVYTFPGSYWYFFLTVTAGETVCCGLFGYLLYRALSRREIFKQE